MTAEIDPNENVAKKSVLRETLSDREKETDAGTSIRDHIEHCTEVRALIEFPSSSTITHIEHLRGEVAKEKKERVGVGNDVGNEH
jgi:hypothetical protein